MRLLFTALACLISVSVVGQDPQVGDFYQGGIVFYTDSLGHGLIMDTMYLAESEWGLHWVNHTGAEEEFIGAGQFNTNNLAEYGSEFAAAVCTNSSSGGYSDWFLPSKQELWQLMSQITLIDSCINIYGGDPILETSGFHWSSTQASVGNAWTVSNFFTLTGEYFGVDFAPRTKSNLALVRAIRCIDNDCVFADEPILGCNDSIAENYEPTADVNDNSCIYIMGCTDADSCNYDSLATMNDFSCDYSCIGCTDIEALNYVGDSITIDDGSCLYCTEEYQIVSVDYDTLINNSVFFSIDSLDISFEEVIGGPFSQGFCIPDGCYTLSMFASCDITDVWYGNTFTIGEFSYTLDTVLATVDFYIGDFDCNGDCVSVGSPCDDEDANTLNDVIQEDCECAGTPNTLVNELEVLSVLIYPNPASDNLTIDLGALTGLNTTIKLYDSSSKLVFVKQSTSTLLIDVSGYAKGLYTLELSTSDKVLRSKVVIE
jgi:hypothetical protein